MKYAGTQGISSILLQDIISFLQAGVKRHAYLPNMTFLLTGRTIFALAFLALSVQAMIMQDFNIGRPPTWPETDARVAWSYIGGLIVMAASVAVIVRRYALQTTAFAGLTILVSVFLIRNIPDLISKDLASAFWSLNAFKTLALAGGCFVVSVSYRDWSLNPLMRKGLLWFGVISLAYFLFICGLAHFRFVDFLRGGFIPAYIPL
jgi:hypothetical protein